MGNKKDTKLIVLSAVLLVTCIVAYSTITAERINRGAFLQQSLGAVQSFQSFEDIALEPQMTDMLDLDDHIFRNYQGPGGNVNLYVGYYYTTDKAYASHSPLACFPSQGWKVSDAVKKDLAVGDRIIRYAELTASIQGRNELVLYWYQAGEKTTASVTQNKYNALFNKVMRQPEDHAFVRVSVPYPDAGKEAAEKIAHQFIQEFYPLFLDIIFSSRQSVRAQGG